MAPTSPSCLPLAESAAGAIDTVPLGGLVGDDIHLVPERVVRLAERLKKWVALRRTPPPERRLAILLYGFPPGVGAAGTAALLNVPRSLEAVLRALREQGYDLGPGSDAEIDGEAIVAALRAQEDARAVAQGAEGVRRLGAGAAEAFGARAEAADVSMAALKAALTFSEEGGPNEWGPIPFLPDSDGACADTAQRRPAALPSAFACLHRAYLLDWMSP